MIVQVSPEARVNLVTHLASMRETGEFCDFIIKVQNTEIRAHKCVLAAACQYFRTSFRFNAPSSTSSEIDLTHMCCDASVVEKIIQSFYTNEIDLDAKSLDSILHLADYFMSEELKTCIESYMDKTLNYETTSLYFQLAFQYHLKSTGMFNSAKWLMWYRFHDLFIYHPDSLDASLDVIEAFMDQDVFSSCNPLQIMEFMLNNLDHWLENLHPSQELDQQFSEAVKKRFSKTLSKLSFQLDHASTCVLMRWRPFLLDFLHAWVAKHTESRKYPKSYWEISVKELERKLARDVANGNQCYRNERCNICVLKVEDPDDFGCSHPNCQAKLNPKAYKDPNVILIRNFLDDFGDPPNDHEAEFCCCAPSPVREYLEGLQNPKENSDLAQLASLQLGNPFEPQAGEPASEEPLTISVTSRNAAPVPKGACQTSTSLPSSGGKRTSSTFKPIHPAPASESSNLAIDNSESEHLCDVIVVISPSTEMSFQLSATDAGEARPLVRSPQLVLNYYDIEMKTWRKGCKFDLLQRGPMLEKHGWKIAFVDSCLYMFSLYLKTGLEFDIRTKKWKTLSCKCLFVQHDMECHVKSVIPYAVGDKLIVLSLSKAPTADEEFVTQQHYYEMDPHTRLFNLVATVRDERLDTPVSQSTVHGRFLISVKASTMQYRQLSRIQYIHVYDSESRQLETHEVICAMEAGIKVLAKSNSVYLLDKAGWCRSYNLESSAWTGLNRYPYGGSLSPYFGNSDDIVYPALTKVSCHAGTSRWEVSTCPKSIDSHLKELIVNKEGELSLTTHPPPPFHFMTAACSAMINRGQLNAMEVPRYEYLDERLLNFSMYKEMSNMFPGL